MLDAASSCNTASDKSNSLISKQNADIGEFWKNIPAICVHGNSSVVKVRGGLWLWQIRMVKVLVKVRRLKLVLFSKILLINLQKASYTTVQCCLGV